MAILATAHVVSIGAYDEDNVYVEVKMVAKRGDNSEVDANSQLFVIAISGNAAQDIRDAVKAWTGTNWGIW